jgi:hypothetical protein
VAALFVPLVPVTQKAPAQSTPVFHISDQTIQQGFYVDASSPLSAGQNVSVSWSASNTVEVYVFNSTQYSTYAKSGDASSPVATQNLPSGTFGFQVPATGTYYLVVYNENTEVFGAGNLYYSIILNSAGGTATSPQRTTSCNENVITALSGGRC